MRRKSRALTVTMMCPAATACDPSQRSWAPIDVPALTRSAHRRACVRADAKSTSRSGRRARTASTQASRRAARGASGPMDSVQELAGRDDGTEDAGGFASVHELVKIELGSLELNQHRRVDQESHADLGSRSLARPVRSVRAIAMASRRPRRGMSVNAAWSKPAGSPCGAGTSAARILPARTSSTRSPRTATRVTTALKFLATSVTERFAMESDYQGSSHHSPGIRVDVCASLNGSP